MGDSPRLTPTRLARAAACRHSWHLECFEDATLHADPDEGLRMLFERGNAHERAMIARLPGYAEPDWDHRDFAAGAAATRTLMADGAPWICQGVLARDEAVGIPDLLQRTAAPSILGGHGYVPVDIKNHREVTRKDRVQLQAYAWLLEPVLGARPVTGGIWLNTGAIAEVALALDHAGFEQLLSDMRAIAGAELETKPWRCSECRACPWQAICTETWEATDSITLLPGVTAAAARKLSAAGYERWRDVVEEAPAVVAARAGLRPATAERLVVHAQARATGEPQALAPATFPAGVPVYYYDIETFGDAVYLHGLIREDANGCETRQFFAPTPDDEAQAWHALLDYLARDAEAHVYCWATYEFRFVASLWDDHGGNPAGYRHLRDAMHDQCRFLKEHFALPVDSYGIKTVAPLFGFAWNAEDAGGLNSEAWYGRWLETGDSALRDKLLRYNRDDVAAMLAVDEGLRALARSGL